MIPIRWIIIIIIGYKKVFPNSVHRRWERKLLHFVATNWSVEVDTEITSTFLKTDFMKTLKASAHFLATNWSTKIDTEITSTFLKNWFCETFKASAAAAADESKNANCSCHFRRFILFWKNILRLSVGLVHRFKGKKLLSFLLYFMLLSCAAELELFFLV